tara:strand:- start:4741 stop:5238 length:498 start_codon:yes stop_codon:yes gene_type:complete
MTQLRMVIRSMLTSEGIVTAMDDSTIIWKPKFGKIRRTKIQAPASVLLGVIGPKGVISRIIAGDRYGGVSVILLPEMKVVDRYVVGNSEVRSLCLSSLSGDSILVGCDNGSIHMVGQRVPNRVVSLFELEGPASAIRVVGQDLHVQQGWERKVMTWSGQQSKLVA